MKKKPTKKKPTRKPVAPFWTLVHRDGGHPVVPLDSNPGHQDEGMLVYRSPGAAASACEYQRSTYGLECIVAPLTEDIPTP